MTTERSGMSDRDMLLKVQRWILDHVEAGTHGATRICMDIDAHLSRDAVVIDPSDLIFEAWPKDPGGMRVYNPRGVMVTHKPTGCVCTCTHERSQHKNRDVALAGIKAMLTQRDGG